MREEIKNKEVKLRRTHGITLIALVITIVVLLILAAVSIATLTGQNGILTRADEASEQTKQKTAEEKVAVEVLGSYGEDGNIDYDLLNKNLQNVEGLTEGLPISKLPATVVVDGYDVTINADGSVTAGDSNPGGGETGKTDGSYDTAEGVNTPKLKDNMKLVVYDNGNWVEDTTKSAYKYEAQTGATPNGGTSEWANAELEGNYYVWIPRYAYKIDKNTSYTSQSGISYKIDIKFLIGTTNQYYGDDGELKNAEIPTNADEIISSTDTYYVHPAFTFGTQNLEGLWIGKYESSDAGNEEIAIVPNVTSLRDINVSTMFSRAQTLSKTNIDAHMLKNTEWGAVAYLTQSQYGRNGTEVSVNQCSDYITGVGRGIGTGTDNPIWNSIYSIDGITQKQRYDGEIGKLSSTTGNVYGIYDMSGGAYEYVMGVYGTNNSPIIGSSGFTEFPEGKYYNLYTTMSINNSNIGDALYETSGWNDDYINFVNSEKSFFARGRSYDFTDKAGMFIFSRDNGRSVSNNTFRVSLVVN